MKFLKGYDYIVKGSKGYWYLVRQTGQRTWVAIQFTNVEVPMEERIYFGNGIALWTELNPQQFRKYTSNKSFRQGMFDILMNGKFMEEY